MSLLSLKIPSLRTAVNTTTRRAHVQFLYLPLMETPLSTFWFRMPRLSISPLAMAMVFLKDPMVDLQNGKAGTIVETAHEFCWNFYFQFIFVREGREGRRREMKIPNTFVLWWVMGDFRECFQFLHNLFFLAKTLNRGNSLNVKGNEKACAG